MARMHVAHIHIVSKQASHTPQDDKVWLCDKAPCSGLLGHKQCLVFAIFSFLWLSFVSSVRLGAEKEKKSTIFTPCRPPAELRRNVAFSLCTISLGGRKHLWKRKTKGKGHQPGLCFLACVSSPLWLRRHKKPARNATTEPPLLFHSCDFELLLSFLRFAPSKGSLGHTHHIPPCPILTITFSSLASSLSFS